MGDRGRQLGLRSFREQDRAGVLALIEADRLPGQPVCEVGGLEMALAGTATQSSTRAWWEELDPPTTVIAAAPEGDVAGAVSFAARRGDGAGLILWLHAREDPEVTQLLLDHAVRALGPGRPLYAFHCGPAWTLGAADGLPLGRRPAARRSLDAEGFTPGTEQTYWHRLLTTTGGVISYPLARLSPHPDPPGWRLELTDTAGTPKAEALLSTPQEGIGVLWWLAVEPAAQGRGIGRRLLEQCLEELAACGAREVIALVDQEPPGTGRAHPATAPLLRGAGFGQVDHLSTYLRRP